ncbi:MAG: DUF3298 domain-containing protein [Paludibacter sp.]
MHKQSTLLTISILSLLMFFSCTQKGVKTEEKDLTKRYFLSSDTTKGALNIDIHVEIPIASAEKNILDSIRATVIKNLFGKKFSSHSNDSILQLFVTEIEKDYKANNEPLLNELDTASSYSFNNDHTIEGFSLMNDKKIYVYGIDRYVYMGGAHGLSNRTYFNFDLKTGKVITEKDLFSDNSLKAISELIKVRIVEESKETSEAGTPPIRDLDDTDFWTDSIKPNGNFYISDESINYVFNPYEIAPYYIGQTEVSLPFERISKFLKPNNPIAYLVEKKIKK